MLAGLFLVILTVTVKSKTEATNSRKNPNNDIVTADENGNFSFRYYYFSNAKHDFGNKFILESSNIPVPFAINQYSASFA